VKVIMGGIKQGRRGLSEADCILYEENLFIDGF
jgi:hypothetical protein